MQAVSRPDGLSIVCLSRAGEVHRAFLEEVGGRGKQARLPYGDV